MRSARLRWQCRRGMRELDELLLRWLDARWASASDGEKQAFEALLELPDPELAGYLLKGAPADDPVTRRVVAGIRGDDSS